MGRAASDCKTEAETGYETHSKLDGGRWLENRWEFHG